MQKVQKCCTVPKKNKKTKVWRPWAPPGPGGLQTLFFLVFLGQYGIFACFGLKRLVFLGQYSVFAVPGLESAVLSQKNQSFKAKSAKMLYCPKKTKKTKVQRPWAPPVPGGLQTLFFLVFLGQYGIFACFGLKRLFFFGTVQRFCSPRPRKCCTVPKTNLFKAKSAKMLYCPKKTKKTKKTKVWRPWAPPEPGGLQTLVFLVFLGQYGIFAYFCLKRLVFWDSTAFLQSQASKVLYCPKKNQCCTVPKKPKKPKFGDLGLLQGREVSKLWFFWFFLGQYGIFAYFCLKRLVFLGQCSVFAVPGLESAVLSQKNQSF